MSQEAEPEPPEPGYFHIQVTCETVEEEGQEPVRCVRDYHQHRPGIDDINEDMSTRAVLERFGLSIPEITRGAEAGIVIRLETEFANQHGTGGSEYNRLLAHRRKAHKRRRIIQQHLQLGMKALYITCVYFLLVALQ